MKKKQTTIIKYQHGARYEFTYPSISECARCLGVHKTPVRDAFYTMTKTRTFNVKMESVRNFNKFYKNL